MALRRNLCRVRSANMSPCNHGGTPHGGVPPGGGPPMGEPPPWGDPPPWGGPPMGGHVAATIRLHRQIVFGRGAIRMEMRKESPKDPLR